MGFETLDITFEGLGKMFKGDFLDTCGERVLSGKSIMRRPGSKDPIGVSGFFVIYLYLLNIPDWRELFLISH